MKIQHISKEQDSWENNISKLKDDKKVPKIFKIELKNRLQILTDMENAENETVEEKWRKIQTAFLETSENVLGFKEKNKKDRMIQ